MTITEKLLQWYDENKRDLPWRDTKDPYAIWASEIMLQQTRVDTAIDYYNRFLSTFPDVHALASAGESDVLNVWKGLGYYSRARNMMRAAKAVVSVHGGEFPRELPQIMKLPGIGAYTAGAILSIAYNISAPAVDGNVLRVIARLCAVCEDIALPMTKKKIQDITAGMISAKRAGDFTQALMELGALVCIPSSPHCESCPLRYDCAAFSRGLTDTLPFKAKKTKEHPVLEYTVLALRCENYILMQFRENETLLGKMWGLPMAAKETSLHDAIAALGIIGADLQNGTEAGQVKHVFTHRTWLMSVMEYPVDRRFAVKEPLRWVETEEIHSLPIPTAYKKVLKLIQKDC